MMKRLLCASLLFAVVFMGGCSKKESMSTTEGKASYSVAQDKAGGSNGTKEMAIAGTSAANTKSDIQNSTNEVQKKIIQTGDIRIIVDDLKKTSTEVRTKINELGGYVESENLSEVYSSSRLRVPADKLQTLIEFMEDKYEVQGKNFSSQDITDAYVDNEARTRNLKAQEAQILEIMKKANTVEEVLKVQNELSKVRGEIESLESRKKVWDRDVNFSTVNVNANKKQTAIESKLRALSASEFGKSIGNGFKRSTTALILFIQNITIFILSNIIILAVILVGAYFIFRKYVKGKK